MLLQVLLDQPHQILLQGQLPLLLQDFLLRDRIILLLSHCDHPRKLEPAEHVVRVGEVPEDDVYGLAVVGDEDVMGDR